MLMVLPHLYRPLERMLDHAAQLVTTLCKVGLRVDFEKPHAQLRIVLVALVFAAPHEQINAKYLPGLLPRLPPRSAGSLCRRREDAADRCRGEATDRCQALTGQ